MRRSAPRLTLNGVVHREIVVSKTLVAFSLGLVLSSASALSPARAASDIDRGDADEARFRALYETLVEIDTTRSNGDCTRAAEAMRARLLEAGYAPEDARIYAPDDRPRDGALIARLHGRDPSLKPILLLAHIDVVEARREDWGRDPFELIERDGWFTARGASDDKAMASVLTDSMIRYKREGFAPRRGLKLALTCGEETPDIFNSVEWLLQTHPETLDAAFVLNEGASGELDAAGRHIALQMQAGEKLYQDFELIATDVGGHSSRPTRANPIHRLARGLARLGDYRFPVSLSPVTRAYFERQRALAPASEAEFRALLDDARPAAEREAAVDRLWAENPGWNSMLRTTCIATMAQGGHAANALPQRASANINCRILPGVAVEDVRKTLQRAIDDEGIAVNAIGKIPVAAPVPTIDARMLGPVREVAESLWPGVAVVPTLATGATDGRFLNAAGIPTYGLSGLFHDAEGPRSHGLNERVRVRSLLDSRRFLYEVIRRYADAKE